MFPFDFFNNELNNFALKRVLNFHMERYECIVSPLSNIIKIPNTSEYMQFIIDKKVTAIELSSIESEWRPKWGGN